MKRIGIEVLLIAALLLTGCTGTPDATEPPTEDTPDTEKIMTIPEDAFPNSSNTILYARRVGSITGTAGFTNTMEKFNVYGTDLGIPYYDETTGRLTLLFGDTYAAANFSGNWRSNVALYTTQKDYSTGIAFDGALCIDGPAESGVAVQLTPGANTVTPLLQGDKVKTPLTHTCIPTGVVMIGETTYIFYMEIDKNAFPPSGGWGVYCNRVVKSEDHGKTWTQVESLVWQAKDENEVEGIAPNFAQIYPVKADGYVYIYGICGGRSGGVKLGRVLEENFEDFEAYEYFAGNNAEGAPIWRSGTNGLKYIKQRDGAYVIDLPCGEMCVTYNEYLGKYLALYQSGSNIVYRTADTPWGTFSAPQTILSTSKDLGSGYGAFTCQQLSDHGGQRIWIMCSEWTPVYNVSQIEVVFK